LDEKNNFTYILDVNSFVVLVKIASMLPKKKQKKEEEKKNIGLEA
jgi:hypothetical protein